MIGVSRTRSRRVLWIDRVNLQIDWEAKKPANNFKLALVVDSR